MPKYNLYINSEVTPTELLTNGDFEIGDPPSDWTSASAAVLSGETGTRTGGSGLQVMRVTALAGDTVAGAYQSPLVVSQRYRATGWARGDGTARPELRMSGGAPFWYGTSSTDWQKIDIEFVATSTRFDIFVNDLTISGAQVYAEFDDCSVVLASEQVTNGDFEEGDPPDDWTADSGATLSSQSGARTGGSGTQYMRVTTAVADAGSRAIQTCMVVGEQYRVTGWARGDGVNGYPKLLDTSYTYWTGTTSTTWQYFSVEFTATSTDIWLGNNGDVATEDYADFDDFSMVFVEGPTAKPETTFPEPEAGKFAQLDGEYAWGSGVLQEQETIAVTVAGQTTLTLSNIPLNSDNVLMFINGIKQDLNNDYFVTSTTVTYAGSLTLQTTDTIEFWYLYVAAPPQVDDLALWWEGDFEGAETETSSPTVFTSIPNRGSLGGTFSSSSTARPTKGHIESGDKIIPAVVFDDTDDYQLSSLDASVWTQAHREWTWVVVMRPTGQGRVLGDHAGGATTEGMDILWNSVNDYVDLHVGNGSALVISQPSSVGSVPVNETTIVTASYSDAAGYDIRINGVSDVSGALAGDTTGDPPTSSMYIGATTGATAPYGGQIFAVLGYSRVLTTAEMELLEAHFAAKYQRSAVPFDYYPEIWLRSDLGIERRNITDSYVETWRDLSGNAHDASETTEVSQPAWISKDSNLNHSALDCDGASSMEISEGVGWGSGTSHTLILVSDLQDGSGTVNYLLDAQSGRLIFGALTITAGKVGWWDAGGIWRSAANAVAGTQILEWHLDSAGIGELYRDGAFIGTETYSGTAIGGDVRLFSNYLNSASYLDAVVSEIIHRDSLLINEDLSAVRGYLLDRYGFTNTPLRVAGHEGWIDPNDASEFVTTGSYTGAELLTNGDFENGDPPSDWSSASGATLSSEPGNRTGGSGTQYLRVTIAIADAFGRALQAPFTIGNRYRVTGWARGDGANGYPSLFQGGNLVWTGTTSNTWQYFDEEFTSSVTDSIWLGVSGNVATEDYAEFDDISAIELEPVIIAQDKSRNLITVLANGDFETGSPPSSWSANGGSTLSAQAGARTGGSGTQVLRVALPIADDLGSAIQNSLVSGTRYRVDGWARGDGVNGSPRFYTGATIWTGSTSNTWEHFQAAFTASAVNTTLATDGDLATADYSEWDDLSIVQSNDCYQETEANRPVLYDGYLGFTSANSQYLDWIVPNASAGTIWAWVKPSGSASGGARTVLGSYDGTDRCALNQTTGDVWQISFAVSTHNTTFNATTDWAFIAFTWDGTNVKVYKDGEPMQSFANAGTASTRALIVGGFDWNGAPFQYWDGSAGDFGILNRAATATEIEAIRQATLRT